MRRVRREAVVEGCDGGDVPVGEEVGENGKDGAGGLERVAPGTAVDVAVRGWWSAREYDAGVIDVGLPLGEKGGQSRGALSHDPVFGAIGGVERGGDVDV